MFDGRPQPDVCVCVCVCVRVHVCGQGVLPFSSSIIQRHAFSVSTAKPFQIMAPGNQMLIDTRPHTHTHTHHRRKCSTHTRENQFDWHDVAWLDSFVALLHHLWPYNRRDWWFFQSWHMTVYIWKIESGSFSLNFLSSASLPHLFFCILSSLIVTADFWREISLSTSDPLGNSTWYGYLSLMNPLKTIGVCHQQLNATYMWQMENVWKLELK